MSLRSQPKPPTPEQQAILESKARIRVVRACPGAGKTEVFVDAIRRRLETWDTPQSGLAALSFTNIAREMIEERAGNAVQPPHYIGTLDAFVFRFIVKPFAHLVELPKGQVRLIPAVVSEHIEKPDIQVGATSSNRASLFSIHFAGYIDKNILMTARVGEQKNFPVDDSCRAQVFQQKKNFWKGTGIVTHSDCHFLAWWILNHKDWGENVRNIIALRFPAIFIDEVQDTGSFLAKAFLSLMRYGRISALVVGDPNQAIYGFGGATASIFNELEKLEGASIFPITLSHRCSQKIARLVSRFSADGAEIRPLASAAEGKTTIVIHELSSSRLTPSQAAALRALKIGDQLAVICRQSKTAKMLRGEAIRDDFCGKSKAARRINIAVQRLLNGEPREASQIVERELRRLWFPNSEFNAEALDKLGISKEQWRAGIHQVITGALKHQNGETWNDWVERVKEIIIGVARETGNVDLSAGLRSYIKCNQKGNALRQQLLDVDVSVLWDPRDVVTTVHKVKGAEFDTVVLFVPKPHGNRSRCPSTEWWSITSPEEKRVAFVAISRAKMHFALCMHKQTYESLQATQSDFVDGFDEVISLGTM